MASSVRGSRELRARLRAIQQTFKPAGREWAEEAAEIMSHAVPVRSGRLQRSFRVKNASQRRASVAGHFTAFFIDAGTKAHEIKARKAPRLIFNVGGNTIFAKKVNHPATKAAPFRERSAQEALRRKPLVTKLIELWNRAA